MGVPGGGDERLDLHHAAIPLDDPATAAVALEVARRGCVLLKNDRGILPLDPGTSRKLAVIGPFAEQTPIGGGGSSYNKPWRSVSLLDGLRQIFGGGQIEHSTGMPQDNSTAAFAGSQFLTPAGAPGVQAEYFNNLFCRGTPVLTRVEPRLEQRWGSGEIAPGVDTAGFSVRWTGRIRPERTGRHVFYQWFGGPFRVQVGEQVVFDVMDGADIRPPRAVLELEAGREYPVEVLYRRSGGFNGACVGWAFWDQQADFRTALEVARASDTVIFCGGFSSQTEGEAYDRSFAMQAEQEELLLALAEVNPRIVVVLTGGGNVDMRRWLDRVPGLLMAWYPGQEGGTALAEILAGVVNPSGRLPVTFERRWEDRSSFACYHDADGDRRVLLADGVFTGYRHHDRTGVPPQFPFGFGLSYTAFAYRRLECPATMPAGGALTVRVELANTGARDGIEVVQLYLRDCEASVPRPYKELKGFVPVALPAGESRSVELTLREQDLQFFCPRRRVWVAEPGRFEVLIGASAADIRLTAAFQYC